MEGQYRADSRAQIRDRGHNITELNVVGAGMGMIKLADQDLISASCWRASGTPIGIAGGITRKGARLDT
jgi:gamma-glutamyltranspeptidase/glutathione hydrolase